LSKLMKFRLRFLGDSVDSRPYLLGLTTMTTSCFWGIVWTAGPTSIVFFLFKVKFLGDSVDSRRGCRICSTILFIVFGG